MNLKLTGPVNCARPATIVLYRPSGEVAELRGPVARCSAGGKPACANGKDDDGDGMIDDHFADGATDPDPGCTSTTDTTGGLGDRRPRRAARSSSACWDDTGFYAGARTKGCGAIQGFWYHAPGTVSDCGYRTGTSALLPCQKVGETGGTMFAATTQDLDVIVETEKAADCRPMTLALIKADNSVWSFRAKLEGC